MIFVLLSILIIYLFVCYYIFNKDLFSPPAILCEVYILSIIACIYNMDTWHVNMHLNTFLVIAIGNLIFIITAIIIHKNNNKKDNNNINTQKKDNDNKNKLNYINISTLKYIIILLVFIIISVVLVMDNLKNTGNIYNSEDFSKAMIAHRYNTNNGIEDNNSLIAAFGFFLIMGSYILIYIFINNIIVNRKKISNYFLMLPVSIYLISTITTAQRTTILLTFLYTLFITYTLLNQQYDFISKINVKYIRRGSIAVIVFLILFGATRAMFGRVDTNKTLLDSVTYYIGNSIEALDTFLQNPSRSIEFGDEMFKGFRTRLSKYGLSNPPINPSVNLEFRFNSSGVVVGNVYTAYRKYIHDFGYFGIIIFSFFSSAFYSIWYEKLKKRNLKEGIDISLVFYATFISQTLFRHSILESLFSDALSDFPRIFICTVVWYIFIKKINITYEKRKIL